VEAVVFSGLTVHLLALVELLEGNLTLVVEHARGHETLDLWGLVVLLAGLRLELAADDVLADIVFLGQVEQLADVRRTLWSETTWDLHVGEAWDFGVTGLDNDQVEHRKVWADDATTDRLALALTLSAWTVARLALREKKAGTAVRQHTLLHWETLLVVTTRDAEDEALELIAEHVALDFLRDALLVESTELQFIIDFQNLLGGGSWVSNVELHFD
jgi:hypothetical protein